MRLPDVVLCGAPKCGTSSVFNWLAAHPRVSGSVPKETFYLMDEDHPLARPDGYHRRGLAGYGAYFPDGAQAADARVEATTHYLYQDTARRVLAAMETRPRIVCLLRRPSARVYSSFRYTRNNLARIDPALSFERYVEIVTEGPADALDDYVSHPASAFVLKRDVRYSEYVDYLDAWQAAVGVDRLHVFTFESMRRDPRAFMHTLCARLGLDGSFYDDYDFERRNETVVLRNHALQRHARKLAAFLPGGRATAALKSLYYRLQRTRAPRAAGDEAALRRLDAHFAPFNRRLAERFDLDLAAWEPASTPTAALTNHA